MFDVSEEANKFMVGYTFYEDRTRAWPPHNHTDQEEVYSFIEGQGAMQVYEEDDKLTFVKDVKVGDHITIPLLNYHPVFSHEDPSVLYGVFLVPATGWETRIPIL